MDREWSTPWKAPIDNDTDGFYGVKTKKALIRTRVDHQDSDSLEDLLENGVIGLATDGTDVNIGNAVSSQAKGLLGNTALLNNPLANRIIGSTADNTSDPDDEGDDSGKHVKNVNGRDYLSKDLKELKRSKYRKNVKMLSKIGLYNSYMNVLGNAMGLFTGSVGKGALMQAADSVWGLLGISDFALGLNPSAVLKIIDSIKSTDRNNGKFSSVDVPWSDLAQLNIANFYSMYSGRPGSKIRQTNKSTINYISGDEKLDNLISSDIAGALGMAGEVGEALKGAATKEKLDSLNMEKHFFDKEWLKNYSSAFAFFKVDSASGTIDNSAFSQGENIYADTQETGGESNNKKNILKSILYGKSLLDIEEKSSTKPHRRGEINTDKLRNGGVKIPVKEHIDGYINGYIKWLANGEIFNAIEDSEETSYLSRTVNSGDNDNGGIYVEPFYDGALKSFFIPFEFNADINDGGITNTYNIDKIFGRVLAIRQYISTESDSVTVSTTYMAMAPDDTSVRPTRYTDGWMRWWTVSRIRDIEKLYKSLMYPYINGATFVRPPLVRIIPPKDANSDGFDENAMMVNDLFKYPVGSDKEHLQVTKVFDSGNNDGPPQRAKRYIVTNLKISPTDSWNTTYGYNFDSDGIVRNGFKVDLTLVETTKNFLDGIPTYASYTGELPSNYGLKKVRDGYDKDRFGYLDEDEKPSYYGSDYDYDKDRFGYLDEDEKPSYYDYDYDTMLYDRAEGD